jgi:hypothetical protein
MDREHIKSAGPVQCCGWDSTLAAPFELICSLPRIFTASQPRETFSAQDSRAKYWVVRESSDKLWLYCLDRGSSQFTRHYFHLGWSLRDTSVERAVTRLTELIRSRRALRELTLDISEFQQEIRDLRSAVELVAPRTKVHLSTEDAQALEYLCLSLDCGPSARVYLHDCAELHGEPGIFRLPQPLPKALRWMRPSLEVWLHNGNLIDLQTPFVEIGAIGRSSSPIETMKAFASLFESRFPEEVAKSLDDYIAHIDRP